MRTSNAGWGAARALLLAGALCVSAPACVLNRSGLPGGASSGATGGAGVTSSGEMGGASTTGSTTGSTTASAGGQGGATTTASSSATAGSSSSATSTATAAASSSATTTAGSSTSGSGGSTGNPVFEQQGHAVPQTKQSMVSATYAGAQGAGNTNILAIGWNDTTAAIGTVTDTSSNVYLPAMATFAGNGLSQAIYYASNIAAAPPGANHVKVTFSQAAVFVDLRITEYSGLGQPNGFDTGVSASGTGTTAKSPSVSTADATELLFAAAMTSASFTGAGAGFTKRVITAPDGDIVEDNVVAAGAHIATAPLNNGTWLIQLAAFHSGP